jgi:hypothetical protein
LRKEGVRTTAKGPPFNRGRNSIRPGYPDQAPVWTGTIPGFREKLTTQQLSRFPLDSALPVMAKLSRVDACHLQLGSPRRSPNVRTGSLEAQLRGKYLINQALRDLEHPVGDWHLAGCLLPRTSTDPIITRRPSHCIVQL